MSFLHLEQCFYIYIYIYIYPILHTLEFQVEALCVLLANGKNNCDVEKIVKALSTSGAKLGIRNEELVDTIPELQTVLA